MSNHQQQSNQPVALVTGASTGIGEATARALHAAGYRVFGTYRKLPKARASGIEPVVCDVTLDESVGAAVAEVQTRAGRIDLLVNNAGIGLYAGAEESSVAQAKSLFDVNFYGAIRMTNAVLPILRQQRSGRIVNISSVLGLIPSPYSALYSASKHAIEGYSESLDHEIRGMGIRVVLVEPAYTATNFESNLIEPDQPIDAYKAARLGVMAVIRETMKKADAPEVVAKVVVQAAKTSSPRRRYTAGSVAGQVSFLRRFVPESAFDKSLRKQLGLPA